MKKKRSYVPAILIGILGIAVTYFIDSSQNKQWQGKIREENNKTAEILRTEIKQLFCKKYLMMEIIVSELVSSPEKEKQVIEKYAEKMKPWELTLVKDFSSAEISSFLIAVRDNPQGKAMTVERVAGEVNSLYIAYPVGKSGQILLAESSPEDILLSSCSDFLPKYKLSLYATDLFGEKKKIILTGNKDIQESFKITFPVLKHKHNLILKLVLRQGKGPAHPNRIEIWVSGLGITLLLVSFLAVLKKKNIVLEESKQVIEEDKRKLHELANKDPLTNIFNRRHFEKLLHAEFRRAQRYKSPLSCIMLDIDHFKNFNDTYGHQFGDIILKEVAALFKKLLREIDIIARYGGEEFVILLPETDSKGTLGTAERLRTELEKKEYSFGGKAVKVTASFGGSAMLENSKLTQPEKLVLEADNALYQAKEKGRNCVCYSELREEVMDKNEHLVNDLKKIKKGGS